ncbi:spore germination protein KB [Paenibacillus shirakamiensis]|uniref:Spore germination protein KB n=1 Tax=Paenibacillus shirakamiensis TaxID=1265935 RepID=A0ABS4JLK6_9BACL|nr:GerAB/ArcD/ProY family transporter [Paenibacillus shirakamiensis]MBP2001479.1 spore germination protein KB [Paenibacillus shirakamiensis]
MISIPLAFLVTPLITSSGYQGWIALLTAAAINVLLIYCTVRIGRLAPQESWIQFGERIMGKWLHRSVLLLIALWTIYYISLDIEQFTLFYGTVYMKGTPPWFIQLMLGFAIALTARWGFATMIYLSDTLFILLLTGLFFLALMFSRDANFHMLPALLTHHKLDIAARDTLSSISWFGEWFIFLFLAPELTCGKKTLRNLMLANLVVVAGVFIPWLLTLLNFGPYYGGRVQYPILELIRSSSYSGILGNADPLVIGMWLTSMFIHDAFLLYVGTLCLSRVLNFKSGPHVFISLLGGLATILAFQYSRNSTVFQQNINSMAIILFWAIIDCIPIYYILVALFRGQLKTKKLS